MKSTENLIRHILIILCESLTIGTILTLFSDKQFSKLLLAFTTILLILLPGLTERLLHCRFSQPLYLFALFYAIGPMLGHCNNFYYLIPWWDKLLHIMGGIMFTLLGMYIFTCFGTNDKMRILGCLFALFFSVTISVVWEFFEFGMDQIFSFDMQDDSIVTSITSYALGCNIGQTETLNGITTVIVDGVPFPFSGYLDIGLIDTMMDMLLETIGGILTALWIGLDNGRHSLITSPASPPRS